MSKRSSKKLSGKKKNIPSKPKPPISKSKTNTLPSFWKDKTSVVAVFFALAATFLVFFNTTSHSFVNWDDDKNFYENEYVTTISSDNFWNNTKDIFTHNVIGNYNPLSTWSFAIEKMIFGLDNPGKWHRTNILLHLLCVFFVFRICLLLGLRLQGALFVSLLFGIHPMRVESVAWVTERKDVLFGAFYLSALYYYIRGKLNGKKYFWLILLLFSLSLFSKIQAVILPLSMITVDYYLSGKITLKSIFSKIPYFILSLIFGILGVWILKDQGSLENATHYPAWQRIFVGSYSYLIYLIKAIVPFKLVPMYPYSPQMPAYYYPTILMGPAVLYGLYYTYKNNLRVWFFGLAFFTVNIMFLLQILGAGQGFMADRFTYIAYLGLFFIAGYFFDKYIHENQKSKMILYSLATGLVIGYTYMSYNQNKIWKNSETLWTHVLKYYKNSTLPYGNRANYLREQGRIHEALSDYSQAIRLKPDGKQAYNSRARLYFDIAKGRDTLQLALQDYTKAIGLDPSNGEFYVNRGATYARLGNTQNAINDLNKGLKYKPDHAVGYLNRSVILNSMGKIEAALSDINSYIKLKPFNANIWYEKARALRTLNRLQDAVPAYSQAIKINPREAVFYYERGRTYYYLGKPTEAKKDILMSIRLGNKNVDPEIKQKLNI